MVTFLQFFSFFAQKLLKIKILTNVRSTQTLVEIYNMQLRLTLCYPKWIQQVNFYFELHQFLFNLHQNTFIGLNPGWLD